MKVMATWTAKPGTLREAVARFLAGKGNPPAGLTQLGRWHSVDLSTGFTLYEVDDITLLYAFSTQWADLLDITSHMVIEDAQAAPLLAKMAAQ